MDSIFPFIVICLLPLVWTALVFAAGRWSVRYRISVQAQPTPYQQTSPDGSGYSDHYSNFEEV